MAIDRCLRCTYTKGKEAYWAVWSWRFDFMKRHCVASPRLAAPYLQDWSIRREKARSKLSIFITKRKTEVGKKLQYTYGNKSYKIELWIKVPFKSCSKQMCRIFGRRYSSTWTTNHTRHAMRCAKTGIWCSQQTTLKRRQTKCWPKITRCWGVPQKRGIPMR